jgi:hypothetical protein
LYIHAELSAKRSVQGVVAHLEEKDLAPSTIRHAYLLVGGLFSSALESDLIVRSPCRGIKLPKNSYTEMRFLTPEEVTDLAEVLDGPATGSGADGCVRRLSVWRAWRSKDTPVCLPALGFGVHFGPGKAKDFGEKTLCMAVAPHHHHCEMTPVRS